MKFQAAYAYMKERGYRIKLPEWGGYWYWKDDSIRLRTKHGDDFDIRETDNVNYTLQFMFRDDWELAGEK